MTTVFKISKSFLDRIVLFGVLIVDVSENELSDTHTYLFISTDC